VSYSLRTILASGAAMASPVREVGTKPMRPRAAHPLLRMEAYTGQRKPATWLRWRNRRHNRRLRQFETNYTIHGLRRVELENEVPATPGAGGVYSIDQVELAVANGAEWSPTHGSAQNWSKAVETIRVNTGVKLADEAATLSILETYTHNEFAPPVI